MLDKSQLFVVFTTFYFVACCMFAIFLYIQIDSLIQDFKRWRKKKRCKDERDER